MQEQSSHCHHRYSNAEDNPSFTREDGIECQLAAGTFHKWSLFGHIDYPFDPKELSENSVLDGRTQLYIQLNDVL